MIDETTQKRRARLYASYEAADHSPQKVNQSYSRAIRYLRVILPLVALCIIGILFFAAEREEPALPVQEIDASQIAARTGMPVIERNELVAPEFASETKSGRKYKITAARAVQELRQPDLILMEAPRGEMEAEGTPIKISARDGTYNQKTQFMTLNENIEIVQEGAGKIMLKTLEADLARGEIHSPHMVIAEGDYGRLEAGALKITNNGDLIILQGPVLITLEEGFETWGE